MKNTKDNKLAVRYNLLTIILIAISYKLDYNELISAIYSECDFKKTPAIEYKMCVWLVRLFYYQEIFKEEEK